MVNMNILTDIINIIQQGTIEQQIARLFLKNGVTSDTASKLLHSLNTSEEFYTGIRNEMNNINNGVSNDRYRQEIRAIKQGLKKK